MKVDIDGYGVADSICTLHSSKHDTQGDYSIFQYLIFIFIIWKEKKDHAPYNKLITVLESYS
ncbi:MAG: hypothetical protein AB7F43_15445, partial [Bacteriovoracia bacterium]